jgi:putative NADH-flavin reductase
VASLKNVLPGHDAVLAPVAPKAGKYRQKSDLLSKGALNLVSVMSTTKAIRLMWVTSAGVEPEYVKRKNFLYKGIIKPFFLANIYDDFKLSEDILEKSPLDWVVIRPSRLTNGPLTKIYRVQATGIPENANSISRTDVAHFMLSETIDRHYDFKKPIIAY